MTSEELFLYYVLLALALLSPHSAQNTNFQRVSRSIYTFAGLNDTCKNGKVTKDVVQRCQNDHGMPLVEIHDCNHYCCVEGKFANSPFVPLLPSPELEHCGNGIYIGSADSQTGEALTTFQGELSSFPPPIGKYVGCISRELYDKTNTGTSNYFYGSYMLDKAGQTVISGGMSSSDGQPLSIRVWDLSSGCENTWHYRVNNSWPVGEVDSSVAVFCQDVDGTDGCSMVKLVDSMESEFELSIDRRFFGNSICVFEADVDNTTGTVHQNLFGLHWACTDQCRREGKTVAYIGAEYCLCGTLDMMRTSVRVADCDNPCLDSVEMACGSVNNSNEVSLSVYNLFSDDIEEEEFRSGLSVNINVYNVNNKILHSRYWQCVNGALFNSPAKVLPDELHFSVISPTAAQCLIECDALDIAMIMRNNHPNSADRLPFQCVCMSEYRFRMQDIAIECLNHWCPGVQGPCVDKRNSSVAIDGASFAAVYCKNCGTDLLMSNEHSGICEAEKAGFRKRHPVIEADESKFLECNFNQASNVWSWTVGSCADSEILDEESMLCKQGSKPCSKRDARGVEWIGRPYANVSKSCSEGINVEEGEIDGMAYWYCNGSTGEFNTPQPDRSDCVESWIDEAQDSIDQGADAVIIAQRINHNLSSNSEEFFNGISGGGLVRISEVMLDLISLREHQQMSSIYGSDDFAEPAYKILSQLFSGSVSWQEVPITATRHTVASRFMSQVDLIGSISLELMAKEDAHFCIGMAKYPNTMMRVDLSRGVLDSMIDDFVYEGMDVKVKVPRDYLIPDQFECVNVIGASYQMNLRDTQMLPEAPTSVPKKGDEVVEGLHATIVEFSMAGELNHRNDFKRNVTIRFQHGPKSILVPQCVYWNFTSTSWMEAGCYLDRRQSSYKETVCSCNHLTNFAIIFGPGNADNFVLHLLSLIFGILSCICLIVTLTMQFIIKLFRNNRRSVVQMNRNLCLLIGQLLFLTAVGIQHNEQPVPCTSITFITHFFWMATFSWIALEGYLLFLALIIVFDKGVDRLWTLYIIGYVPAIIISSLTLMTAEIQNGHYFREDACWLDYPYVWAFTGPVVFVLAMNSSITIWGLITANRAKKPSRRNIKPRIKAWLANFVILSYLLGITWIIGFFNGLHVAFQYIFVCLNSSTGVFILLHSIVFNRKVRERLAMKNWSFVQTLSTGVSNKSS